MTNWRLSDFESEAAIRAYFVGRPAEEIARLVAEWKARAAGGSVEALRDAGYVEEAPGRWVYREPLRGTRDIVVRTGLTSAAKAPQTNRHERRKQAAEARRGGRRSW